LQRFFGSGVNPIVVMVAAVILNDPVRRGGARGFGLSRPFGLLTAGAVATCGASAALAISAVLPRGENDERGTISTVIGVTTLSTVGCRLVEFVSSEYFNSGMRSVCQNGRYHVGSFSPALSQVVLTIEACTYVALSFLG
jgi:uncharacterized membrane protein YadS